MEIWSRLGQTIPERMCGQLEFLLEIDRLKQVLRVRLILVCVWLLPSLANSQTVHLSDTEAERIGRHLWQNECGGTVAGLTSWNSGENFASLGIGHFIWYPVGEHGAFEESFPRVVSYLKESGVKLPSWLTDSSGCPWPTRAAFLADLHDARLAQLREILSQTVPLQARFAANRLEAALPKILTTASSGEQERIKKNFYRVAAAPSGMYPLVDYVNFKGEGTSPSERYQGEGWGLLQVLNAMSDGPALRAFSVAADRVLTRRVQLAPPERHEERWLPGWRNRVHGYAVE